MWWCILSLIQDVNIRVYFAYILSDYYTFLQFTDEMYHVQTALNIH